MIDISLESILRLVFFGAVTTAPLSRGSVASTLGDNDVKLVNLKKFVFKKWLLLGGEIPPLLEFSL